MDRHPIESLMTTTMESIRDMVDVNTVIGDAITTPDGATVIPLSRVSFGFVAGGGEYAAGKTRDATDGKMPFAGGSGAGVSVLPMGFLVLDHGGVRLMPAAHASALDRLLELLPQALEDVKGALSGCQCGKKEKEKKTIEGEEQQESSDK